MADASRITALVGPTNTGKTHRAVERMLEHTSGMIGLPLRLLAREVYDKVSARIGEERVALVTGEEQRIPRRPDYWISTTEAMPVERDVDFVAVDEVQLAATEQRGHVFTSRILSARGRKETWLLGAGTMSRILGQLVPTAEIATHPRLSSLKFVGKATLGRVPPRSALVAFSLPHVYELAEKLRARKGGAAVVLGALSPRTRNAQVAMFQAGEVDYLVATDAIGMGLNLGVSHVAFASLRKFDGRGARPLEEAELAQIAGRARPLHPRRHLRDARPAGPSAPGRARRGVAPLSLAEEDPLAQRPARARLDRRPARVAAGAVAARHPHAGARRRGRARPRAPPARSARRADGARRGGGAAAVGRLHGARLPQAALRGARRVPRRSVQGADGARPPPGRLDRAPRRRAGRLRPDGRRRCGRGDLDRAHRRDAGVDVHRQSRELARARAALARGDAGARRSPERRLAPAAPRAVRRCAPVVPSLAAAAEQAARAGVVG